MVQETEAAPVELDVVSCGTCDTLFISSERRQTCPACGGEGVGPFFEFVATPEGPRLKNGAVAVARAATPPAEPAATGDAVTADAQEEQEEALSEEEAPAAAEVFAAGVQSYLVDGGIGSVELEDHLLRMGATPEDAATAKGRLEAIYTLVDSLEVAAAEPQEEAAAEEPAAPAADPEAGEEAGQDT